MICYPYVFDHKAHATCFIMETVMVPAALVLPCSKRNCEAQYNPAKY